MKNSLPNIDFSINERIRQIRKALALRQEDLSLGIKMSRTYIAQLESNRVAVLDRVITLICMIYGVNEKWLRTGVGNMFDKAQDHRLEKIIQNFKRLDEDSQDFILKQVELITDYRKKVGKK